MALTDTYQPESCCSGDVAAFGALGEVVDQIEQFLRRVLPSILANVRRAKRKDGSPRNELDLCAEIGKRLLIAARGEIFSFWSEDPDDESAKRVLDLTLFPQTTVIVGARSLTCDDKLYAIEAKRLPTNRGFTDKLEREREYVVSKWGQRKSLTKSVTGGIERFKEAVHGGYLERAGMIAFIQKGDSTEWLKAVNSWVVDLVHDPLPKHAAKWRTTDQLEFVNPTTNGVAELLSRHERPKLKPISLRHFWLDLVVFESPIP